MNELEQRLEDIRVLKRSLYDAFDALAALKEIQGSNHSKQQHLIVLEIQHYLTRWSELAEGTYIPPEKQAC
jgi:hypothetical protein